MARRPPLRKAVPTILAAIPLLLAWGASAEVLYSLDADSPSRVGGSGSDVLVRRAGPAPAAPLPVGALGPSGEGLDEVDALSHGGPGFGAIHFSVDRLSLGPDRVSADDATGSSDELDALALERPGALLFSLAAGNLLAFGGADVLAPGPQVAIPASALGLGFLDDIDALHVDGESGDVYLSLTPASPSLATLGASPADVLVVRAGSGRPVVFAAAAELGLGPDDNLDALAFAAGDEANLELAGPCASPRGDGPHRADERVAFADLVFSGAPGGPAARLDPACGRDLAAHEAALVACLGAGEVRVASVGTACP